MDFNEHRKEQSLQKHPRFIFSEKIHLKALELLLFGFPEKVKLLDHFFQSYNKNYSFSIFGIPEVDEPSRTSEYYDPRFQDKVMMTKLGRKRYDDLLRTQIRSQSNFLYYFGDNSVQKIDLNNRSFQRTELCQLC